MEGFIKSEFMNWLVETGKVGVECLELSKKEGELGLTNSP